VAIVTRLPAFALIRGRLCHYTRAGLRSDNGGSITAPGVPLTENFDSLASSGTGIVWTDDSTIPGCCCHTTAA
jgi:hypothetical protein